MKHNSNASSDLTSNPTSNSLEKAKVKIFCFITLTGYVRAIHMFNIYIQTKEINILFISIFGFAFTTALLLLLIYRPRLFPVFLHVALIVTFSGTLFRIGTLQEFYITQVQTIFMSTIWSFYGLGKKWGIFYSTLFTLFLPLYIYLYGYTFTFFPPIEDSNFYTTWLTFILNAIIIIIAHYIYQDALTKLLRKKKDLNIHLTKSLKANKDFSSTITHELRTPLNSVIGLANLLKDGNHDQQQKEHLSLLKFSAEGLLELINNVLDFNKLNAAIVNNDNNVFDVIKLTTNTYNGFQVKAQEKKINMIFTYDPLLEQKNLKGDSTRLMQVLFNLIGNAVKFTPENGEIQVDIRKTESSDPTHWKLLFSIKDNGIGIQKEQQQEIFEPFKQAHSKIAQEYGGSGLGLAIVKKTLETLNSEIKIQSTPHEGSTFYFEISLDVVAPEENITVDPPIDSPNNFAEMKLLLVDDNKINIAFMQSLLKGWGIYPSVAYGGLEAIEKAKSTDFDIILMDLYMPEVSGFEASLEIRKLPHAHTNRPYIIAISAANKDDVKEELNSNMINDFIGKPFEQAGLKEKLMTGFANCYKDQ